MSDLAIEVEGLSKRYHIGVREKYPTLREALVRAASQPLRAVRHWASGQDNEDPASLWALRDIDLEVNQGEVVGIIGRNGAGKSTLLKVLSGITEPTAGYADIYGRVGSLLEVGTGFHMELTGRENIFMNGALLGMRRHEIKRKFDEIVAFAEVEKFLDTPVKRYSSGMYLRLAFAVAAHLDPEILIVDEVLAVGDLHFQKKCLGKMEDVARRQGRTVLFVSHNMAAISALCSTAIVLDAGKTVCKGSVAECIGTYTEHVSGHVGSAWTRTSENGHSSLTITEIKSRLTGVAPSLVLLLEVTLQRRARHKPAFLAVDILDTTGRSLMQALPRSDGFITDAKRQHVVNVVIDLPPLIPGQFLATVWVGSHYRETLDQVKEAVLFEVHASPTQGRSFPHTPDHGYVVPASTVTICE
jgi:lipopolysaccharide transport system ATP-binding protein